MHEACPTRWKVRGARFEASVQRPRYRAKLQLNAGEPLFKRVVQLARETASLGDDPAVVLWTSAFLFAIRRTHARP